VKYRLIDSVESLEQARAALEGSTQLYLDTEFESNRNGTRLCLLQVSRGHEVLLIDAVKLPDLTTLRPVFENPTTEWVLHAGVQDVHLIAQSMKLSPPPRLFDTQVAWSMSSAENSVSLSYLQFKLLGVRSSKAHQADDWILRPLPESQLRYAASDVEHLPKLAELLIETAKSKQRLELVYQASHEALTPLREPPAPLKLESFRNAWQLDAKNQAGLLFLIAWYNGLSADEKRDTPDTKTLLSIASRLPESIDVLGRIKGVQRNFVQHFGRRVVTGMAEAARNSKAEDFTPIDPPPYATFAETRLDAWLGTLRAEICTGLEVAPEFVLPARVLKELKFELQERGSAGLEATLQGFRRALLGPALRAFCDQHPPPL